jgi:hypothetical protein
VPPNVIRSYNLGWNGSAVSVGDFSGDAQMVQFVVPVSSIGVVCGLNENDEGSGYGEIDHGLYLHSGLVQIVEGGVPKTSTVSYAEGDVFTIARLVPQVQYWQNYDLLYTSFVPSTGTKFIDVSMFSGGDTVA